MEKWVLCSEQLPPELDDYISDNVLIVTRSAKDHEVDVWPSNVYIGYFSYRENRWWTSAQSYCAPINNNNGLEEYVVAWREIPGPDGL